MEQQSAPIFSTTDHLGNPQLLENYHGKKVLLYFYPKDMTPGCTTEALGFQERYEEFTDSNVVLFGISQDSSESHQKFCTQHGLEFPLLMDEKGDLARAYDVFTERTDAQGKIQTATKRESFLIDEEGVIIKHWSNVKPMNHPQEVLDFVKNIV